MARQFLCGPETTVETTAGKLRGFQFNGTYIFQGIKYADAKRFQAPEPVKPWEGVRDAMSYGYVCPLLNQEIPFGEQMVPHRYWLENENCQYLNIWSQTLDKKAKKPVMVWLHGGAFAAGSSIEQIAYDGENMSRRGDVVVVSLNHRLNILGYMNLSAYGEKYANAGNAGNADMVAALLWIHENIASFGGDPENVTLFGQSGGGMKVWTLMQTPSADGLFHKGIIQSGVIDDFLGEETDAAAIVEALMKELGLTKVEELETVPYHDLALAYNKVSPEVAAGGHYIGGNPMANDFYRGDPRSVGFTEHAKTIPLMIGTVFAEFAFGPGIPDKYTLSDAQVMTMLEEKYQAGTLELVDAFQKAYPDKHLSDLMFVDPLFRIPTIDFAKKKSACGQAPIWSYMFSYEFPIDGGKPAWHCAEIPFVFANTDKVPICNIPGVSDKLEDRIFTAWVNFAHYGDPNCPGLPRWDACTPEDEPTMIFDRECRVLHNYDHELQNILKTYGFKLPNFSENSEDTRILH